MFKVKKETYINRTFRIPCSLDDELRNYASLNEISLNALVIQCCQYALANRQPVDDFKDSEFKIEKKKD